ncbi:hypothetical protein G3I43_33400 [Streptomyces anulatus]|uniref:Uncharacterized protein n=1 Tax=Streptomyces anulatus TaxID=1892 RepID=A0A6G3T215_STRAQ|nr:hypothetical protein [Streptomyces anulatus]NEB89022.1 hypothetical protein [Streptomyces anulatus]
MVATVTGPEAHELVAVLEAAAWHVVAKDTLVLVRIDREEPYWAQKAAQSLTADGITVDISPRLREAMAEEWTWAAYPMPWCTRAEIREVSDQAQQVYDAIRHGRLRIHAHAHDGYTTIAVGTYPTVRASTFTAKTTCVWRATPTAARKARRKKPSRTSCGLRRRRTPRPGPARPGR